MADATNSEVAAMRDELLALYRAAFDDAAGDATLARELVTARMRDWLRGEPAPRKMV